MVSLKYVLYFRGSFFCLSPLGADEIFAQNVTGSLKNMHKNVWVIFCLWPLVWRGVRGEFFVIMR